MRKYFAGLSANTFLLALASLFADTSTEMLYPILPVFLTQTLGDSLGKWTLTTAHRPGKYVALGSG
jgi:hypothetical protein